MTISFSTSELRRIVEVRLAIKNFESFLSEEIGEEVTSTEVLACTAVIVGLVLTCFIAINWAVGLIGLLLMAQGARYLSEKR